MRPLLDICSACNARCGYCLHQLMGLVPRRFMERAIFIQIADILQREKFKAVHLYMSGEPMLHPEFADLVLDLSARSISADIATRMTANLDLDRLANVRVPLIFEITVDSLDPEVQRSVAPGISSERMIENLDGLLALKNRFIKFRGITIAGSHNERNLKDIDRFFRKRGIPLFVKTMGYYMPLRAGPEEIKRVQALLPSRGSPRFEVRNGRIVSKVRHCPFHEPAISADGDVTICCHDMLFSASAGNVLKSGSLIKILKSPEYVKARRAGDRMMLDCCKGCN